MKKACAEVFGKLQIPFEFNGVPADRFGNLSEEIIVASGPLAGLEVGHIYKLFEMYQKSTGRGIHMSSYGIGIDRAVAAALVSQAGGKN
jgi:hypothetical protein